MTLIPTWARSDNERASIETTLSRLIDTNLSSIEYIYPAHYATDSVDAAQGWDRDPGDVILRLASGVTIQVSASMERELEGLAVRLRAGSSDTASEGADIVVFPSSRLSATLSLPQTIVDIRVSWHTPDEEPTEALWAISFQFSAGSSMTIALGENGPSGELEYIPDTLAIIYDRGVASAFRIPASLSSAWGRPVRR